MTWTPLADGPGDALDEAVPHVAANTPGRLISNSRGGRGSGNAPGYVAAGQDESTIVQLDEIAEPSCARLGADHYEDGRGGDLFSWPVRTSSSVRASRRAWPWPSATRVRSRTSMLGVAFS
jgi:hypothetical protein